jgi:branched-chain amino acid transport system permease protein
MAAFAVARRAPPSRPALARTLRCAGATAALVAACAVPLWGSPYQVFQMTLVLIDAIALLGLNVLTGYGGQISLGHGAFFGIGAYTTAILTQHAHVPYAATIPCAGAVCLVVGFVFGLPAARLEGLHLALATFALGVVLPQILKFRGIGRWTGGVQGISLEKPPPPFGLPLSPDQWLYLLSLGIAATLFALTRNLIRGHAGRTVMAVRDCPVAASSVGIDVALCKALTFGVSAMLTGIAGALGALAVQFVGPDSFSIFLSIGFLVGIVVGGLASLSGALFGAAFIRFVPNLADDVSKAAPSAVYGVVLIVCVYLMPFGIAGLLQKLRLCLQIRIGMRHAGPDTSPKEES